MGRDLLPRGPHGKEGSKIAGQRQGHNTGTRGAPESAIAAHSIWGQVLGTDSVPARPFVAAFGHAASAIRGLTSGKSITGSATRLK